MEKITINIVNNASKSWHLRRFMTWVGEGIAHIRTQWIKNKQLKLFSRLFDVNWQEARYTEPNDYPHFDAFFTRQLKSGERVIDNAPHTMVSPVDGYIAQLGTIEKDQLLQAKGFYYGLNELLGDAELAKQFEHGQFMTIYLAPHNYHRVHCPFEGYVSQMRYIPGRLFSVNADTTANTPQLFTRNERVVTIMETPQGPMAVIFVGAGLVGSVVTSWAGRVCPPHGDEVKAWQYPTTVQQGIHFDRGEELGYFALGSTIILLTPAKSLAWKETLTPQTEVRVGQEIGYWNNAFSWCYAGV